MSVSGSLTAEEDNGTFLDDALESVNRHGSHMVLMLDQNNLKEGLRIAALMVGELRTVKLLPKNYYQLYMAVTNNLRELETHFEDMDIRDSKNEAGGRSVVDLYEIVQHAGNIIPRLYLLTTVASVYIKSKKAPAKDILFDLVELCRGVQHPMRGLFLRHYLSQMAKDKLPDQGNEFEGAGGSVADSLDFIVNNFGEMNKLWVRMQHQGAVRDKGRRESERRNLRQLVGTNLTLLSQMAGVNLQVYTDAVLPRILEQIVNCKDAISQEYLMDCTINVFPDEFHLHTLETFLSTCSQLQEGVNIKAILVTLMSRLANYAKTEPHNIPKDVPMFPLFHKHTSTIIESGKMDIVDVLELQVALVNFSTKVYPTKLDYVDGVLGLAVDVLKKAGSPKAEARCVKQVVELLTLPLEVLSLKILALTAYAPLMQFLELDQRKSVSVMIVEAVLASKQLLDTPEKVESLLTIISPLIQDAEAKEIADDERNEFDQDQQLVARLFHLISNEDTDQCFKLYLTTRKFFGLGGTARIEYTLTPMIMSSMDLAQRVHQREENKEEVVVKTKRIFGFLHETITVLAPHYPELALRLFLQAAATADKCSGGKAKYDAIGYEFVAQAFICYEDQISDSKQQFQAITYMVACLQTFTSLTAENYDTLITKASQHSAKLLKKTDQCRAVYNCAHLFWPGDDTNPGHRDEKRVLACLQRSLKIANACMGSQVHLFVEILNKYLFFFDKNCPSITANYLKGLIGLIDEHLPNLDASTENKMARIHYQNTKAHITMKQGIPGDVGKRYLSITHSDA